MSRVYKLTQRDKTTVQIDVGIQPDGYVFTLNPRSRLLIELPRGVILPSSLFASFETMDDFSRIYGGSAFVQQVPIALTGWSTARLRDQGFERVVFFDVVAQKTLKEIAF